MFQYMFHILFCFYCIFVIVPAVTHGDTYKYTGQVAIWGVFRLP